MPWEPRRLRIRNHTSRTSGGTLDCILLLKNHAPETCGRKVRCNIFVRICIAVCVAVAVSVPFARTIVQPLRALEEHAQRFRRTKFKRRIPLYKFWVCREIEQLIESFNAMAEDVGTLLLCICAVEVAPGELNSLHSVI